MPKKPAPDIARLVATDANRVLLKRFAPPSVLVDEHFDVVQRAGQTQPYLERPAGRARMNVVTLVREGLQHPLRAALEAARTTRKTARCERLALQNGNIRREVNIEIVPLVRRSVRFYLVLFEQSNVVAGEPPPAKPAGRRAGGPRNVVAQLEEEVAATREYLQTTIQEIEAANKELQAANEEILATNETLQSTNEELDTATQELLSTNQELNLLNDELAARNEELRRVNTDLAHLLESTSEAIVIVSRDQRIRRFTSMAGHVLALSGKDIGRPLADIDPARVPPDILPMVSAAIDTGTIVEHSVHDLAGQSCIVRITPCNGADGAAEGAAIAITFWTDARSPSILRR